MHQKGTKLFRKTQKTALNEFMKDNLSISNTKAGVVVNKRVCKRVSLVPFHVIQRLNRLWVLLSWHISSSLAFLHYVKSACSWIFLWSFCITQECPRIRNEKHVHYEEINSWAIELKMQTNKDYLFPIPELQGTANSSLLLDAAEFTTVPFSILSSLDDFSFFHVDHVTKKLWQMSWNCGEVKN